MASSLEIPTAECLAEREGLVNEGLDIRSLNEDDVSVAEICSFFGPKHSKNGWLYNRNIDCEQANEILSLYKRVTGEDDILNRELTLTFYRGVIGQCKGLKLNWAAYGAFLRKYRVGVRNKKASIANRKEVSGLQPHYQPSGSLSVLQTPVSVSLPYSANKSLLVTPKSEGIEGSVSFRGRGRTLGSSKSKAVNSASMSPNWTSQEIESVREVLATRKSVYEEVKASIEELHELKETEEGELRRARLNLSDRKVLYAQAKLEVDNYGTLLDVAKKDCSKLTDQLSAFISYEGIPQSSDPEFCQQRIHELQEEIRKISDIVVDRESKHSLSLSEQKFAHERFLDCERKCSLERSKVIETTEKFENRSQELKTLETEVFNFEFQVQRMCEGGGIATYLVPLLADLSAVPKKISLVNACPVCNSCYSCNNHVSALCGHTYHPFCLLRHASSSKKCVLPDCEIEFSKEWCVAWGIQAPKSELSGNTNATMVPKTTRALPRTYRASSYTSQQKIDCNTTINSASLHSKNRSSSMGESHGSPWNTDVHNSSSNSELQGTVDVTQFQDASLLRAQVEHAPLLEKEKSKQCSVCNDRPTVIFLEACGHSLLCFQCVQGKKTCPVCQQSIVGWKRVDQSSGTRDVRVPLSFSISSAFNIPAETLFLSASAIGGKKRSTTQGALRNSACEEDFDFQNETGSETEDDELQKWIEEVTVEPQSEPLSKVNVNTNTEAHHVQEKEDLQPNNILNRGLHSGLVNKKRGKKKLTPT